MCYNNLINYEEDILLTTHGEVKIQIKTGLSFCNLKSELAENLDLLVKQKGLSGRGEMINQAMSNQFSWYIDSKEDLVRFDELLKINLYQSRGEWLRELIRRERKAHAIKTKYNNNPDRIVISESKTILMSNVAALGMPMLYINSFTLKSNIVLKNVRTVGEYYSKIRLYYEDDKYFLLNLNYGTLIECQRPDNNVHDFKLCYRIVERCSGYTMGYIGWPNR